MFLILDMQTIKYFLGTLMNKIIYFFIALINLQGCLIVPILTVEDPEFTLEFIDEQKKAIPNLEVHYLLSREGVGKFFLEKYELLKSNSQGLVIGTKKSSFESMLMLLHGSHSSKAHIWTWCVSNQDYLPQIGQLELDKENYKKIILKKLKNNYRCEANGRTGRVDFICKDSKNNTLCH